MDNETTKKKMTKDEKWLLYVQNARIEERNNALNEAISSIGFMLSRMNHEEFVEKFEATLEALKGKQQ